MTMYPLRQNEHHLSRTGVPREVAGHSLSKEGKRTASTCQKSGRGRGLRFSLISVIKLIRICGLFPNVLDI